MSEDVIFRSVALGGFNKEDVLEYISEQKDIIASLEKKNAELEKKYDRCDKDRADAVKERAQAGDELSSALSEIDGLKDEISKKDERINSMSEELEKMDALSEELESCKARLENEKNKASVTTTAISQEIVDELASKDARIKELNEKNEAFFYEIERLKSECEKRSSLSFEARETVGNAIIDARRFSDTIIKEAGDRLSEMSERARVASETTRSKVDSVTDEIKTFAQKFNGVMEAIYSDASDLKCDMDVFTDYFNKAKQETDSYVSPIDRDTNNA